MKKWKVGVCRGFLDKIWVLLGVSHGLGANYGLSRVKLLSAPVEKHIQFLFLLFVGCLIDAYPTEPIISS